MSDASTSHFIGSYVEQAEAPQFLSGFFQTPQENFYTTEKVEIDIERDGEEIAVVVTDLSTGGRLNEESVYSNKAFLPPILQEIGVISAYKTMSRQPGVNPYSDPNYGLVAMNQAFKIGRKLEKKIRRTIELMCGQVLADGAVTLIDDAGNSLFTLDFQAKASHKAICGTTAGYGAAWSTANGTGVTCLADLGLMAKTIRRDGRKNPKDIVMGVTALQLFKGNADVQKQLISNYNSQGLGSFVAPQRRGSDGATFVGRVVVDLYEFNVWGYDGVYKHPQAGTLTPYVDETHVLMLSDGRLDLSYGAIPRIIEPDARAMPFLPQRISNSQLGLDLTTNAWFTPDGQNLMVSFGTRPLPIPTAIDTFGRIKVA